MRNTIIAVFALVPVLCFAAGDFGEYLWPTGNFKATAMTDAIAAGEVDLTTEAAAAFLNGLTAAELRLIRNTLFAKNGYQFKDENLGRYFALKSWYQPRSDKVVLQEHDKAVLEVVLKIETAKRGAAEKPKNPSPLFEELLGHFKDAELPLKVDPASASGGKLISRELSGVFFDIPISAAWDKIHALAKIENQDVYIFLVSKTDPAGGGTAICYLYTFAKDGTRIDSRQIAFSGGDIADWTSFTVVITAELQIDVETESGYFDDATMTEKFSTGHSSFALSDKGFIE